MSFNRAGRGEWVRIIFYERLLLLLYSQIQYARLISIALLVRNGLCFFFFNPLPSLSLLVLSYY